MAKMRAKEFMLDQLKREPNLSLLEVAGKEVQ